MGQTVTHGSGPYNAVTIDPARNRITSMGGFNFQYDASGNLTQEDLSRYKYDAENRLVELRQISDVAHHRPARLSQKRSPW